MFAADEGSKTRAYTLAAAFVRELIRRHGADAPANVLRRMRGGETFERAFANAMGESVAEAENAFWNGQRFWTSIGPFLTTQTALWMGVTAHRAGGDYQTQDAESGEEERVGGVGRVRRVGRVRGVEGVREGVESEK